VALPLEFDCFEIRAGDRVRGPVFAWHCSRCGALVEHFALVRQNGKKRYHYCETCVLDAMEEIENEALEKSTQKCKLHATKKQNESNIQ
jgi:hypothetical protein